MFINIIIFFILSRIVYPYNEKNHQWNCKIISHIPEDMTTSIGGVAFLLKSRYYGGENDTFMHLDFEKEPLRTQMANITMYRMYVNMSIDGISAKDTFYFNLFKTDIATGYTPIGGGGGSALGW